MSVGPDLESSTAVGVQATRLRVLHWIPEARTPRARLLLVHGLGEHVGRYGDLGRALARGGVDVWGYDQRCHGESEGRRGTMPAFHPWIEDLDLLVGRLSAKTPGDLPFFVLGHSFGGLVVLRWLQEPTRSLRPTGVVLSAPWLAHGFEIPRWRGIVRRVLRRFAPDFPVHSGLDSTRLTHDEERRVMFEQDPLVHDQVSARLMDRVEEQQARALEDPLPDPPPLLVLLPGEDEIADTATSLAWARSLPDGVGEVEVLDGFRHEPFQEVERERVERRVLDWVLRQVSAAPRPPNPSRSRG